jgi:hypothetical protein
MFNGTGRDGFRRERCQKLLQLIGVEPQPMSTGTFIERQLLCFRALDLDFAQWFVAPGAEMPATIGRQDAGLRLKMQQGIVGLRRGVFHERFQFACIKPHTPAAIAKIDFDILELQDEQRNVALWANWNHRRFNLVARDDAVSAQAASSFHACARENVWKDAKFRISMVR